MKVEGLLAFVCQHEAESRLRIEYRAKKERTLKRLFHPRYSYNGVTSITIGLRAKGIQLLFCGHDLVFPDTPVSFLNLHV